MDSFKLEDIKMEKANAISRYRLIERITALFRLVELLVIAIVVSRFSPQISFPVKLPGEYLRGISVAAVISPRFVFLVGNAIVILLFLKSRRFPAKDGDFYDEYVEKCRRNEGFVDDYKVYGACYDRSRKQMCRSRSSSAKLERKRRPELSRSMTEGCRSRRNMAAKAEEMSSEEFRQMVEAFIARQQRFLREQD